MKKKILNIGTAILLTFAVHAVFTVAGGVMMSAYAESTCDPDNNDDNDDNPGSEV